MKTIFTILISFIIFIQTYGQKTTEEEYNWMSKGYKVMITSGLDMKKGYIFDDTQEYGETIGNYSFTYKFLKREKDKSLTGVVIVAKSNVSGNTYYYGLPIGEWIPDSKLGEGDFTFNMPAYYQPSDYMELFLKSVQDLDCSMRTAFLSSLFNLFAQNSMLYLPKTKSTNTK
jgi:hypothetical protein